MALVGKACGKAQVAPPRAGSEKNGRGEWKLAGKRLAKLWNRKKVNKNSPRRSWAATHMGNLSFIGKLLDFSAVNSD
jgi:hypothetical protein